MATAEGATTCSVCGGELRSMGVTRFRTGGTTGGWNFFLGGWAELDEQLLPLELLGCTACGRVELRLPNTADSRGAPPDISDPDVVWGDRDGSRPEPSPGPFDS